MNHAEWERKVKDLERRVADLVGMEKLGPVQLLEAEGIINELEELLEKRL